MIDMCIVTVGGIDFLIHHFDKNYELEHKISGASKEALLTDIRNAIDTASFIYIR